MNWLARITIILTVGDFISTSGSVPIDKLLDGRIINGSNATNNLFPYYASVIGLSVSGNTLCGGSIISSDWILTAAICIIGSTKFTIGVGSIFLTAPQISMISTEAYQHDQFESGTLSNNIALIKLPASLNFFDNIQHIQLISRTINNNQFINSRATIAGYGRLSDTEGDISLILQWTNVLIISNAECHRYFSSNKVTDTNLCAYGYRLRQNSPCDGDFGGPLIMVDDETGHAKQIGIISFVSRYGCSIGIPSGYLMVSHYLDWISSITGITFD